MNSNKTAVEPKSRNEVSEEEKWQVDQLYPSIDAWEKEFSELKQESAPYFPELNSFHGRLKMSPKILKDAIGCILSISRKLEKLYMYAHLKHDEAIGLPETKSLYEKIQWLSSEFSKEKAFFEPELMALSDEKIKHYLSSPELSEYRFFLEKIIRMRPYTLSSDKEMLLAMAKKPLNASSKTFSALHNADLKFPDIEDSAGMRHPLSHGLYSLYLRSPDRTLRKNAFEMLHSRYFEFENTFAELISGEVESELFLAQARSYPSSLSSALYPWAIPEEVYTNLIKTVRSELPSLHRYVSLKKKVLGLDKIHFYDLYALPKEVKDPTFSKNEAIDLVLEAVAPLGKNYRDLLEQGFKKERWVDWEETKNKRSGAYSSGGYDSFPYILMNFRGTLRDLFTLAHEAGHSMHTLLSRKSQPFQYYHYPIFVAEIASTLNEELLMNALLKKIKKKEEKILLIHERIEDIRATLFRQTLFAEFELKLSKLAEEGVPMTPKKIKEIYFALNRDYYGPEIELDEGLNIEWARIPHFYYHFYVYQYATGIAAAIALSQRVIEGKAESFLSFLSSGGSNYPLDLLRVAGLDLTRPDPIVSAIRRFNALMDELEKLLSTP